VGAVLGWLPARLRADALRRLQLAAQSHDGPVFLLRELSALSRPSPAPLRLVLQASGPDQLAVKLAKRRGPSMVEPLKLALPPVLMVPPPAGYGRSPPGGAGPTGFGRPGARGDPVRAFDLPGDVRASSIEG
jgi:protein ImuA